jgi:transposase
MENKKVDIKAMLPSELADLYKVNVKTFIDWLKPFNKNGELKRNKTNFYSIKQVQYIFDCLGNPY